MRAPDATKRITTQASGILFDPLDPYLQYHQPASGLNLSGCKTQVIRKLLNLLRALLRSMAMYGRILNRRAYRARRKLSNVVQ